MFHGPNPSNPIQSSPRHPDQCTYTCARSTWLGRGGRSKPVGGRGGRRGSIDQSRMKRSSTAKRNEGAAVRCWPLATGGFDRQRQARHVWKGGSPWDCNLVSCSRVLACTRPRSACAWIRRGGMDGPERPGSPLVQKRCSSASFGRRLQQRPPPPADDDDDGRLNCPCPGVGMMHTPRMDCDGMFDPVTWSIDRSIDRFGQSWRLHRLSKRARPIRCVCMV